MMFGAQPDLIGDHLLRSQLIGWCSERRHAGPSALANFTAGRRAPSRELRAEFHPLVTPMIPLVTRSSRGSGRCGHDTPRKEKR